MNKITLSSDQLNSLMASRAAQSRNSLPYLGFSSLNDLTYLDYPSTISNHSLVNVDYKANLKKNKNININFVDEKDCLQCSKSIANENFHFNKKLTHSNDNSRENNTVNKVNITKNYTKHTKIDESTGVDGIRENRIKTEKLIKNPNTQAKPKEKQYTESSNEINYHEHSFNQPSPKIDYIDECKVDEANKEKLWFICKPDIPSINKSLESVKIDQSMNSIIISKKDIIKLDVKKGPNESESANIRKFKHSSEVILLSDSADASENPFDDTSHFITKQKCNKLEKIETNLTPAQELQRYRKQYLFEVISFIHMIIAVFCMILTPCLLLPVWLLPGFNTQTIRITLWSFFFLSIIFSGLSAIYGNIYWYYDKNSSRLKWTFHCGRGPEEHFWGSTIFYYQKKKPNDLNNSLVRI